MAIISELSSHWILDSRGIPTLQTSITLEDHGKTGAGKASVPSGASTGTYEALELRDQARQFHGKGVNKAVDNVMAVGQAIFNQQFRDAAQIDTFLINFDGTENKTNLGANTILSISMAAHRAFANLEGLELWQYLQKTYFQKQAGQNKFPRLMCNLINGGEHADNPLDIQEFMIIPNTGDILTDVRMASEVYHTLKKKLKDDNQNTSLGDEGGFAPNLSDTKTVLNYLQEAVVDSSYQMAQCDMALDCAANEFYDASKKVYKLEGKELSQANLVDFYNELVETFNLKSIEDAFNEDDKLGWQMVTEKLGKKIKLIGDDLFVTNPNRFKQIGIENKIANGILIKLNQIGTVLETCTVINMAKENDFVTSVSHRSGETVDTFISDLAFASQSEFIKLGAPARGERVAKYNRLLEIKEDLS